MAPHQKPPSIRDFYKRSSSSNNNNNNKNKPGVSTRKKHSKHYYDKIAMNFRKVGDSLRTTRNAFRLPPVRRKTPPPCTTPDDNDDNVNNNNHSNDNSFVEWEDDLAILVQNDSHQMAMLQAIHKAGVEETAGNGSLTLAQLASLTHVRNALVHEATKKNCNHDDNDDDLHHHHHIETVALYIAKGLSFRPGPCLDTPRRLYLAFLVQDNNNNNNNNAHDNQSKKNTKYLDTLILFLCAWTSEIPQGLPAECATWWELRARIAAESRRICRAAVTVAAGIAQGATRVEAGLTSSADMLCGSVKRTGEWVVTMVPQSSSSSSSSSSSTKQQSDDSTTTMTRQQVVRQTYTNAARRATSQARETTRATVDSLLKTSTTAAEKAAMFPVLPPWLEATAQVSMAGFGSVVIVGETVVQSTRAVLGTTAQTAAAVVEHHYGAGAGQSVRDVTATAANLWLTARSGLTLVSPAAWTRVVARHGCKQHVRQNLQRQHNANVEANATDGEAEAVFDHALEHFSL